jgi:2',3'-cyclic-nucleotide 2'-phosphodiesterase (5'-nucleotidase family)
VCNVFIDEEKKTLFPGVLPYIIKEYPLGNGQSIKVGSIGLTTEDTKGMSMPGNTDLLNIGEFITYANLYADTLRQKGCDFVMLSGHLGLPFNALESYARMTKEASAQGTPEEMRYKSLEYIEAAQKMKGVDVAFGGHIHVGYHEPWEDPVNHTMVFQNYAKGTGIGAVRFLFDRRAGFFWATDRLRRRCT